MVGADPTSALSVLPNSILDRILWVHARLFGQATLSPKGFFSTKFFSKLRHLFHVCRVPFDDSWDWHVQESVIYARTTHIGFRSAAQLYVGSTGQTGVGGVENLPGVGS